MDVRSAVKALIEQDGKFLILTCKSGDKELLDLPGGGIVHGETPHEALRREVKEETQLDIDIIRHAGIWWLFREGDKAQIIYNTFLCKPKSSQVDTTKNPSNEQIIGHNWITKKELFNKFKKVHGFKDVFAALD